MLPATLKLVHFGKCNKKSSDSISTSPESVASLNGLYKQRWCVLAYGVFSYFGKSGKAKQFLDNLPSCNSKLTENPLSKDEHRTAFRKLLHEIQPRGYIKLLDRNGQCVSSLKISSTTQTIIIEHKSSSFTLQCDDVKSFNQWREALTALGLSVEHLDVDASNSNNQMSVDPNNDHNEIEMRTNGNNSGSMNCADQQPKPRNIISEHNAANLETIDYDEEDKRLMAESQRLLDSLRNDRDKILKSFSEIRKSII